MLLRADTNRSYLSKDWKRSLSFIRISMLLYIAKTVSVLLLLLVDIFRYVL